MIDEREILEALRATDERLVAEQDLTPVQLILRDRPETGVTVLRRAYEMGGDILNAWDVLASALTIQKSVEAVLEHLGHDLGMTILRKVAELKYNAKL
ncbi:hypothetical protein FDA94_28760 [Herbidospora galbida]|uniref:Uncharacterized protein n=1 Tax=Herbidospora galbida TaxID=2575442 RepID=A0A4V5V0J7_9ACTN|nr:hypothetical protein [Herbidospora galbida]TKK84623.1 hypothetical protein FDA94_28760 [Herbidospora galbida]